MNNKTSFFNNKISLKISIIIGALGCLFLYFYSPIITSDVSLIPDLVYSEDDYHNDAARIYKDLGMLAQRRNDFSQALKLYQTSLDHNPDSQELQDKLVIIYKILSQSQSACNLEKPILSHL
jgi:tetratricopeptide (TPR) repeat protein